MEVEGHTGCGDYDDIGVEIASFMRPRKMNDLPGELSEGAGENLVVEDSSLIALGMFAQQLDQETHKHQLI